MRPLAWLGILVAALVISITSLFLLLPLGLIVVEFINFPLALGVTALLAAIVASWAGNFLARDQTRTNILRVVGVTEIVAAVITLVFLIGSIRDALLGPLIYIGLISALVLALSATAATSFFRITAQDSKGEIRLTLGLLALAIISIPLVIGLASLFGLTGA
jgi:hypothetical protein